jgi:hypothetical protein
MLHWSSTADRVALILVAGLSAAAATPTAAQQAARAGAPVEARQPTPTAVSGGRLMPWSSTADRGVLILVGGLSAAAATPIAAQQADGPGATAGASGAAAGSPGAPLPGPRLRPQVLSVAPGIAERGATAGPVAPAANNTIVISTLALVLIAVIVTILVVK